MDINNLRGTANSLIPAVLKSAQLLKKYVLGLREISPTNTHMYKRT